MRKREYISRFEIDLLREGDSFYLARIIKTLSGFNRTMPYKIGDSVFLTEGVLGFGDSEDLVACSIKKIIQDDILPYRYTLHIKPDTSERIIDGIDWSGSDGWLQLDSK